MLTVKLQMTKLQIKSLETIRGFSFNLPKTRWARLPTELQSHMWEVEQTLEDSSKINLKCFSSGSL